MPRRQNNNNKKLHTKKILTMTHKKLINGFAAVSLFAIFGLVMLFQNTTMNANLVDPELQMPQYRPQSNERLLANEPCKTIDAVLDTSKEYCERIGRLQCNKAYRVKPNYKGDAYVPSMNCLNKCIRDLEAQCKHASIKSSRGGLR